ncbi:MAG: hypothetical protein WA733_15600 [Methylocystis sp.]
MHIVVLRNEDSVELERLIAEGRTLIERRDSMELFRDYAAEARSNVTLACPGVRAPARRSTTGH